MAKIKPLTKEEFKKIRKTLGENQQDFATRLGYTSKCTIAFKESGKRKINRQDEMLLQPQIAFIRGMAAASSTSTHWTND